MSSSNNEWWLERAQPRLERSRCAVCSKQFSDTPITEHDGLIVHVECIPDNTQEEAS